MTFMPRSQDDDERERWRMWAYMNSVQCYAPLVGTARARTVAIDMVREWSDAPDWEPQFMAQNRSRTVGKPQTTMDNRRSEA